MVQVANLWAASMQVVGGAGELKPPATVSLWPYLPNPQSRDPPPRRFFYSTWEAEATEEGAEAEAEAAPRGRGRGGPDHCSDNFFPCAAAAERAATDSKVTGRYVGLPGSLGLSR